MGNNEHDIEPDINPAAPAFDSGESIALMEPTMIGESSRHRTGLTDLAIELAGLSAGFRRSLPAGVTVALSQLVRAMNCYYSNLIEGHDTHPVDIERALRNDYSADARKRDLQLEAKAHIAVQKWIDDGGLDGRATTAEGLRETHRRFCDLLPEALLWVENPDTGKREKIVPIALRESASLSARMWRSALARSAGSLGASKRRMVALAGLTPSSRPPLRITAFCGYTRFSTETAASRD
jgi:hypothetical protein